MPEISVIVPIHNTKSYLKQCIDSIINQTFKNLEIILVDDASSDGSELMCDDYAEKDTRIKVVHKKWGGVVAARKAGLSIAQGKYVGFVDSDDWIEPEFYQYMYDIINDYKASVVETGVIDTTDDYQKNRTSILTQGYYVGDSYTKIVAPNMMYNGKFYQQGITPYMWNKIFDKRKFLKFCMAIDDGCDYIEDMSSVYSYIIAEKSIYISKKCYYHYRVRTSSLKRCLPVRILEIVNKNKQLLYNEITKSNECNVLEKQYWTMMLYIYILTTPYLFDDSKLLEVFGGIEDNERVILYGAGAAGINIWRYLTEKRIKIEDWVDKEYKYLERTLPVHNPQIANYNKADKIIITVLRYKAVETIKSELIRMGVSQNKIMWVKDEYINDAKNLISKVIKAKYD